MLEVNLRPIDYEFRASTEAQVLYISICSTIESFCDIFDILRYFTIWPKTKDDATKKQAKRRIVQPKHGESDFTFTRLLSSHFN